MAQTEGPGPSARDSAAQPAPEEVRRAVALPEVSGDPGEGLTPTTSTTSASGATTAAMPVSGGDARARSADASAGTGAPEGAARTASAGDRRNPEDTGLAAAGAGAHGPGDGNGDDAADRGGDAGRPKKPFLAAAAIAGAVLIAVPLVVIGAMGGDDDTSKKENVANADTLLDGRDQEEPPADYLAGESESPTPSKTPKETPKKTPSPSRTPSEEPPAPQAPPPSEEPAAVKETPKKKRLASRAPIAGDLLVSSDTGKCLSVDAVRNGDQVHVWDCVSAKEREQKWIFRSDGTVRIGSYCLDVRGANTGKNALIQITGCNGNVAQQFRLNSEGEMIAVISNYCLDVWHGRDNGTIVTTNDCRDQPNQRWRRA